MSASHTQLHALLTQSLLAWRLAGAVSDTSDGAVLVTCREQQIRIEPAPPGLPFRWIVVLGGRRRTGVSLVSVLRQVRGALEPGYAAMRARIAPFPLVPT
jgi:hypothetical protein